MLIISITIIIGTSKLDDFIRTTNKNNEKLVKAAEATIAYHTVKHHQSYHSMDCTIKVKLFLCILSKSIMAKCLFSCRADSQENVPGFLNCKIYDLRPYKS